MNVRKGDEVRVLAGKDVGKTGTVSRVIREADRVIVDGINLVKKHQKPTKSTMQGGIIDKEMPIHVSNVGIVCSKCKKATRVGYRFEGDDKIRVCRKCGADL